MRREKSLVIIVVLAMAFGAMLWPAREAGAQTPGGAATRAGTRLITLGTRVGPDPVAHQAQSSNLLIVNGALYLIDAGDGTLRRLAKAGIKFNEIGVIFITHPHSDHIAGLGPLMAIERHDGRTDPINVYGPHGVETIVAGIIQYFTPRITATRTVWGAISFKVCSHLPAIAVSKLMKPVTLPPGLARLGTMPSPTGSDTRANTTGTVCVASRNAWIGARPTARTTSGDMPSNSLANARARSASPETQR